MALSLIPLLLLCILVAAVAGQCAFSPGEAVQGKIPNFDMHAALRYDARHVSFPVRIPTLAPQWQPNSGSRFDVPAVTTHSGELTTNHSGGGVATSVGIVTSQGRYLRLTQSDASREALARSAGAEGKSNAIQQISDVPWSVYSLHEPVWIADISTVRLMLTGSGSPEEFRDLATNVLQAAPIH